MDDFKNEILDHFDDDYFNNFNEDDENLGDFIKARYISTMTEIETINKYLLDHNVISKISYNKSNDILDRENHPFVLYLQEEDIEKVNTDLDFLLEQFLHLEEKHKGFNPIKIIIFLFNIMFFLFLFFLLILSK